MNNDVDPIPFENRPARYGHWPLPPYRYLTGHARPHPTRGGYMATDYHRCDVTIMPPKQWRHNEHYLYGVDLFNRAYWWEAHEAWEDLWKPTEDPQQRDFLQGLILTSAALLKHHLQNTNGATRLLTRAIGRLEPIAESVNANAAIHYMGLNLPDWMATLTTAQLAVQDGKPIPPIVIHLDI